MAPGRLNLPNVITIARILACPAVVFLVFADSVPLRLAAWVIFFLSVALLLTIFSLLGYMWRFRSLLGVDS